MLFNSMAYFIFLPIVVILFWLVPVKYRTPLLLVASYVFYMFWKPIYVLLILALTVLNYVAGRVVGGAQVQRKLLFWCAIGANLLVLGYFKYAYFAFDTFNSLVNLFPGQHHTTQAIDILLPLGISFFTFEFIHYLVDIYKGGKPVKNFLEFALFASFFPTQIAGPIKRYQDFLPQLSEKQKIDRHTFNEAIELIVFGLFKKIVLADTMSIFVDRCYAHPELLTGMDFWLANWACAFQIYFDFSGYTDIARGSALLMGFRVPVNFNLPFLATSVADFWRRWHISLSSWLRDYVYFSLGGGRRGPWLALLNTLVTMAICGLWHGAAMRYVLWGVFAGMTMVVHRLWQIAVEKNQMLTSMVKTRWFHYVAIALTFNAFALGLAIFRSPTLVVGTTVLSKMFGLVAAPAGLLNWQPSVLTTESSWVFPAMPLLLFIAYGAQFLVSNLSTTPGVLPSPRWFPAFKPAYLAVLIVSILVLSPDIAPQFVYFQF